MRMPGDAREVEDALGAILRAESEDERARDIQRTFVETLDFEVVIDGHLVPLGGGDMTRCRWMREGSPAGTG